MLNKPTPQSRKLPALRHERGVVLLMALIVLLAMTLAGLALMRSVSTSNVIAGNMAFQQAATQSADAGVEAAVTFLETSLAGTLHTSVTTGGGVRYLAFRQDPSPGQSWDNFWTNTVPAAALNTLPADAAGNTVAFVIHRLCNNEGVAITVAACTTTPIDTAGSSSGNSQGAGVVALIAPPETYYRITTRVSGPRNTLSYVQVVIAM
jgi:type IV pilus assembly protein PilX